MNAVAVTLNRDPRVRRSFVGNKQYGPGVRESAADAHGRTGFGSAASRLPPAWIQQRCSLVSGNTSRMAFQKPSAPSPITRTGAAIPRRSPAGGLPLGVAG